jgi:hypothetical protein
MADRVSEILLEVTPEHRIARIVIDDVDGSATEYRFSDQKENVVIPEGRFQFQSAGGNGDCGGGVGRLRLPGAKALIPFSRWRHG